MRATVFNGPGASASTTGPTRASSDPTDADRPGVGDCVCGSDLWPYRGESRQRRIGSIGHEYCGIVEDIGGDVQGIRPASSSSARSSRPTTPVPTAGPATRAPASTASPSGRSAARARTSGSRSPIAPSWPPPRSPRRPHPLLLAVSDVLSTGWYAPRPPGRAGQHRGRGRRRRRRPPRRARGQGSAPSGSSP